MASFHNPQNFIAWFGLPTDIDGHTFQGDHEVKRLDESYSTGIERIYFLGPDGTEVSITMYDFGNTVHLVYPEWPEAQQKFATMAADDCLGLIDSLYGREEDEVSEATPIAELRAVAEGQSLRDFTYRNSSQEKSDKAYFKALGA